MDNYISSYIGIATKNSSGEFVITYYDDKNCFKFKPIFREYPLKYYFFVKKGIKKYLTEKQKQDLLEKGGI